MATKEIKTLTDKLIAIQSELKAPKGQYNNFGKYKYRSCEDILEAVKPLLNKYECILLLRDEVEAIGNRYYVKATAELLDANSKLVVTAYAREEETKKGMDGSQITGASSSYARKYALNGLFAIDDTKDSDTTNTDKAESKKQPQTANILNTALAEARACTTTDELTAVWRKYPTLATNDDFKNLVAQLGTALKAQNNEPA